MQGIFEVLFSALLFALALPNEIFQEGFWPLGLVALVPLYKALKGSKSFRQASLYGAVFGAACHALTSYWLFFYKDFAFWTLGTTTLAYSIVFAVAACYGYFVLEETPHAYRPFIFALGWVSLEFLKSRGFLGYPWGLLAYSQSSVPFLLQTADLMGVYGISFILSLASAVLAELLAKPRLWTRQILVLGLIVCLALGYGLFRMGSNIPVAKHFRAALVQQNTDPWISGELTALESNVALARKALSKQPDGKGQACDLIIFSETSLRRPYKEFISWFSKNPAKDPLLPFIVDSKAYILTGAPIILDWDSYAATNSTILISPGKSTKRSEILLGRPTPTNCRRT